MPLETSRERERTAKMPNTISNSVSLSLATDFIDLTQDERICASPGIASSPPKATGLFPAGHLSPGSPPPERPETTAKREAVFLEGFNTQWWAGGFSFRAAILSVNATLRLSTPRFSEVEGRRRLESLFAQGKLAIRHDLVYHLDCDPGIDAQRPKPPTPNKYASPVEQVLRKCKIVRMPPNHSPFGDISGTRFHEFEGKLYSAVKVEKTLFQGGGETLERCAEVLNEWMIKEKEFVEKEIKAAFSYLVNQGKVELDGGVVRLLSLE